MRSLIKNRILKCLAHLLFPYVQKEINCSKDVELNALKARFGRCGHNVNIRESYMIRGEKHVFLGDNFYAGAHFRMEVLDEFLGCHYSPKLVIGNNVSFQDFCHIGCVEKVTIGDGTLIASKVYISDHQHGSITKEDLLERPAVRPLSHNSVNIGRNVWIGDGVCVLPGVTLGDNVIVGSNAVVTHSFPANSVIAGCPAKLIKTLQ